MYMPYLLQYVMYNRKTGSSFIFHVCQAIDSLLSPFGGASCHFDVRYDELQAQSMHCQNMLQYVMCKTKYGSWTLFVGHHAAVNSFFAYNVRDMT